MKDMCHNSELCLICINNFLREIEELQIIAQNEGKILTRMDLVNILQEDFGVSRPEHAVDTLLDLHIIRIKVDIYGEYNGFEALEKV